MLAGLDSRLEAGPGVGLEGERLGGRPGLVGHDEQGLERVAIVDGRGHGRGVGRVEDAQLEPIGAIAKRLFRTSGARLLPPIPPTMAVAKPASRIASPKASSGPISSPKCSGASSQPSRSAMPA